MKRQTVWIVLVVLAALLTASASGAAQTKITVLHAMPDGPPTDIFEQLAREFDEAHPDITVELIWGGGYGTTLEKARVAWASGLAPNIVHIEQMQSFALMLRGNFVPSIRSSRTIPPSRSKTSTRRCSRPSRTRASRTAFPTTRARPWST